MPHGLVLRLRRLRRHVLSLPRRAYLTFRYHGVRELAFRIVTFPVRLTPLGSRLGLASLSDPTAPARRWYRENQRRVAVVIPTYGDPDVVAQAVHSVRKTTSREFVRIIVPDDGSAPEHREKLRALARRYECELILGDRQRGFAANCNRGLRAAPADEDVVLLNSDVVAHPGWLQALQHAAYVVGAGIVGARLLYPDGTIQFGGGLRNPYEPGWFDHRFRGRDGELVEANVALAVLTVTGACMYLTRGAMDDLGLLDESYEMAFEDADYCVRAWDHGHRVLYSPAAALTHHESKTRGLVQGARELRSQELFWSRWGDWFDRRDVQTPGGGLHIVYVTSDAGDEELVAHVAALRERGHEAQLIAADAAELEELDAIKVATDWRTAEVVWEHSVKHGVPVYLVRDLDAARRRSRIVGRVVAGLRPEFSYIAASRSIAEQLRLVATRVVVVTPGSLDDLERVYLELAADSASGVREPVRRDVLGDVGGSTLP
ncbi:MAG: glycosyltransferase [Actinomycetota bacterium]